VDSSTVEAVLEARAECADAERAQAVLADAVLGARAPRHGTAGGWTLTVWVSRAPATATNGRRALSAEAEITDDRGVVVAQRTVTDRAAKACAPLAKAVGAWATLVLDAELSRAKDEISPPEWTAPAPADATTGGVPVAPERAAAAWPDMPAAAPTPKRTIELGTMVYLRNGLSETGGAAGVAPYVSLEVAPSWMLRPGVLVGRSTALVPFTDDGSQSGFFSQYAIRVDFCRRIPGNYIERRGIELDLCAGSDAGVVLPTDVRTDAGVHAPAVSPQAHGTLSLGPSAILRGELGAGLALEVRGIAGANVLRSGFGTEGDAPILAIGGELGVSWRLP
jgi:hypothetical protein